MSDKQTPKVGFVSLGCPKNLVDSEVMVGTLSRQGYSITAQKEDADVIVVNTCGFIDSAKKESIDTILEMAELKTEGNCKKLVVCGCLAEGNRSEIQTIDGTRRARTGHRFSRHDGVRKRYRTLERHRHAAPRAREDRRTEVGSFSLLLSQYGFRRTRAIGRRRRPLVQILRHPLPA